MSSKDSSTAKSKAVVSVGNCRDAQANLRKGEDCTASGIKSGSTVESEHENAREIGRFRFLVRKGGLEPPRYCYRQPLKLVRLPSDLPVPPTNLRSPRCERFGESPAKSAVEPSTRTD